ncbi:MAG: ArsR family transcriptional regulator [Candidatus Bathyarchaeota archaeon]|nr:MAG: ArsR family transcriptional regulator [Candidatus Bathyarchaeota archaeon]
MRRVEPEIRADILEALAFNGPLKLTHIMCKAKVNCNVLKQHLDFLIGQNLVKEKTIPKERAKYAITKRGITVFKDFREQKQSVYM